MKIKTILLMIITIGFTTPIIVNAIYTFDINKYKNKK